MEGARKMNSETLGSRSMTAHITEEQAIRLRELALEIATAKAVSEVMRVTGHKAEHAEAEADFQDAVRAFDSALAPQQPSQGAPIDMVLYCPKCGEQHIDEPEWCDGEVVHDKGWTNPPHRSHLCHGCGHIWRPADVPTNGVVAVLTQGKDDSPLSAPEASGAMTDAQVEAAYADLQQRRRAAGEALFQSKLGTPCTLCSVGKFAADSNNHHSFHRCDSCGHVPMWDKEGKDFLIHGISTTSKEDTHGNR